MVGCVADNPHPKTSCQEAFSQVSDWTEYLKTDQAKANGFALGTWNVRILYEAGPLKSLLLEVQKYGSNLVAIQEKRWHGKDKMDMKAYTFLHWKGERDQRARSHIYSR
jgi:hypothetical protein